ncbi:MAG: DNA polymerase IV [Acholeplasmatales bacterium]|nr:DNA polymerase IV [Acholeplasmatales bacterium]
MEKGTNHAKIIFHIDMNAFFCSVACIKNPELRGKPFAIGRENTTKGVLSTASYEARKYGIHSAMPQNEAIKLLPSLIIIQPNFKDYSYYHKKFVELIKEYTDLIEVASIDELYADMTLASKKKHPIVLAKEIQERLLGEYKLPCSIGIAPTLFLAKMGSDIKKPLGVTVIRKREISKILYPLSVSDIFGIGKKTWPRLIDNGIKTIGDFMNLDNKDKIIDLVGNNTYEYAYNALIGKSSDIVEPNRYDDAKSISECETYDIPKVVVEDLALELRKLTRSVVNRMKKYNYFTKTVTITLRDNHFNTITRQKSLNEYTDDLYFINDIALELLDDNFIDGKEYRLLGVGVSNLLTKEEIPTEHNLFNITDKYIKETEINKMIKEFQTKYGDKALYIKKLEK